MWCWTAGSYPGLPWLTQAYPFVGGAFERISLGRRVAVVTGAPWWLGGRERLRPPPPASPISLRWCQPTSGRWKSWAASQESRMSWGRGHPGQTTPPPPTAAQWCRPGGRGNGRFVFYRRRASRRTGPVQGVRLLHPGGSRQRYRRPLGRRPSPAAHPGHRRAQLPAVAGPDLRLPRVHDDRAPPRTNTHQGQRELVHVGGGHPVVGRRGRHRGRVHPGPTCLMAPSPWPYGVSASCCT